MSITVEQFEAEFYNGTINSGRAIELISSMCSQLRRKGYSGDRSHADITVYSRLASAIGNWFINKNKLLNDHEFHQILNDFPTIISIFALSGFANADYILRFLLAQDDEDIDFGAILLCLHPSSSVKLDLSTLWSISPQLALAWYLRTLSLEFCISENADKRREELLNECRIIRGSILEEPLLDSAAGAWMHCSYAAVPNKHHLKQELNGLFKQFLVNEIAPCDKPGLKLGQSKPKLLVLAEMFSANHAMFRVYFDWIKQLDRDFDVEILIQADRIDQPAIDQLPSVQTFEQGVKIAELLEIIRDKEPDIVFYPSVGMMLWTVILSNFRLASIQVASIGHPATTRSDAIDYMLTVDGAANDSKCYSEKVITIKNVLLTYPAAIPQKKVRINRDKSLIRVAIASRAFKLTNDFLAMLGRISRRAKKRIEFHVFTGHTGISHQHIAHEIGAIVGNAVVHPTMDYKSYLKALFRCELHIESFPFGGTNSNIDSLMLGIPIVCMEGPEPHSSIDAIMLRKIGMPEWIICRKPAQYEKSVLRMINNDDERERVSKHIRTSALDSFQVSPTDETRDFEFADTMAWIYRNHVGIKQSPQQVWGPDDRPSLTG